MNIEKLEIRGFGKLNSLALNFTKGLNIVFGNNESGKTSVQYFIKGMLYGLKGGRTAKDGAMPPIKKYKPWSGNDYNGFIEYRLESGEVFKVGRNFVNNSVRVFDNLFNDITNTFEMNKEKNVVFAEKHLGLNEVCFDKTVFIKQMESKIDDDGSRELLGRLTNVSQTGFEDVSLKKAQEALKEALKNYVGTDKTSTRPLDKVVARLEELKMLRASIIEKRESMFSIESQLKDAMTTKNNLEERKSILAKFSEIVQTRKRIKSKEKMKLNLEEIIVNLRNDQEELKKIFEKINDFNGIKEQFEDFSKYDNEDIDLLDTEYNKLLKLYEEASRLKSEIKRKKEAIEVNENQFKTLKAFSEYGDSIEDSVLEMNKELEHLKIEYDKNNTSAFNEKILRAQKKVNAYKILILFLIGCSVASFMNMHFGLSVGLGVFTVLTCVFIILMILESRKLTELISEKRMVFINISSLGDEIKRKENTLTNIYEAVRAENLEEFLKLKAEYTFKNQQIINLNNDIKTYDNQIMMNSLKTDPLKQEIISKLSLAGIIIGDEIEVWEEHIKRFKFGVRRYKGLEPSINYTMQRTEDLNKNIERHFKNASAMIGVNCVGIEDLESALSEISEKLIKLQYELKGIEDEVNNRCNNNSLMNSYKNSLKSILICEDIDEAADIPDYEANKVMEELKELMLETREYEVLLNSYSGDEEELQKADAEIEELSLKRNQLEDINISLKVALDVLTESSLEIQKDFVPALNNKMSTIINRITAGRYKDLRADSKLSLKTIAPETGDIVSAMLLSGGTLDQMYLALRISMVDLITSKEEKLPLIMDEVFSQYDDVRTKETFGFLNELSLQRQIIFFTCKNREVEIAKKICCDNLNIIELS